LLKKFRDVGTVDRRRSSDKLRSARTDENIDHVNDNGSESRGPAANSQHSPWNIMEDRHSCCPYHTKESTAAML